MYFKNSKAKVEIALARGKNVYDRRADLKAKDIDRDTAQQLAKYK
jgi:SsrA-binding protein